MRMMDMTISPTKTIGGIAIENIKLIKAEPYTDEITRRTTYKTRLYDHNGSWIQDIKSCRTKEEALYHLTGIAEQIREMDSDIPIVNEIGDFPSVESVPTEFQGKTV